MTLCPELAQVPAQSCAKAGQRATGLWYPILHAGDISPTLLVMSCCTSETRTSLLHFPIWLAKRCATSRYKSQQFLSQEGFFSSANPPQLWETACHCQLSYCELVLSYPVWRQIEIKRIFFMWLLNTCLLGINPFQRLSPVFLFYCMQTFEKYTKCFKALL